MSLVCTGSVNAAQQTVIVCSDSDPTWPATVRLIVGAALILAALIGAVVLLSITRRITP